jgi:hypothetical protein
MKRAQGCAVLAAMLGAASAPGAQAAMRGYIVTSFDTIRVEAPVRIVLTTGSGVSGSGEGERAALDRVDLSVSGGVLNVRMADAPDRGFGRDGGGDVPTLTLSTGQLRRATVVGGAVLTIRGLEGVEAALSMSGNGEMIVERADVERLSLYVGGGGKLTVGGTARTVRASVNGPGMLDAAALDTHEATIVNDGSGAVRMTVHGPAGVVSTGSGDTTIGGKPVCTITRRGVGAVVCGG